MVGKRDFQVSLSRRMPFSSAADQTRSLGISFVVSVSPLEPVPSELISPSVSKSQSLHLDGWKGGTVL